MAVLKQTSPTACPAAPKPKPSSTVPSASTSTAVGLGSLQPETREAACMSFIAGLHLCRRTPAPYGATRARAKGTSWRSWAAKDREGHSDVARRYQQRPEGRHEGAGRAPGVDPAHGQCGVQE